MELVVENSKYDNDTLVNHVNKVKGFDTQSVLSCSDKIAICYGHGQAR